MPIKVLLVAAAGLLAVGTRDALAQHYVCRTVQRGESVAQVVQHVTGHAGVRSAPWLTVIDTSRSTIVRRREYDRVLPGWQVCVESWVLSTRPALDSPAAPSRAAIRPPSTLDSPWWLALGVPVSALAVFWLKRRRDRRAATLTRLRQFASRFVHDFERPLVQRGQPPPIRSRLQFLPRTRRVRVYIEPATGRSYPNLTDHRKNLEYDVARVLHGMAVEPVITHQPYANGSWVVLTFQLKPGVKGEGAT